MNNAQDFAQAAIEYWNAARTIYAGMVVDADLLVERGEFADGSDAWAEYCESVLDTAGYYLFLDNARKAAIDAMFAVLTVAKPTDRTVLAPLFAKAEKNVVLLERIVHVILTGKSTDLLGVKSV
jgi:hypothetical protein